LGFQKPSHTFTKIHLKALHTNRFNIIFALSFTVFFSMFGFAQELPNSGGEIPVEPAKEENIILSDTTISLQPIIKSNTQEKDSIVNDSVKPKPKFLKSKVKYKAKDYQTFNRKEQKLYLYNEAEVYYEDMEIKAGIIVIDYNKQEVYAGRIKDTAGVYTQLPIFKQADNVVEPDSIRFNYDTKKALIFNSRTEQNGMNILAEKTKRINDTVYYMSRAKLTTSDNLDDPEYYFLIRKGKFMSGEDNKKVVTGLTNLFIYDVPTPIGLPFAFFPMSEKRTSGIIFPSFGEDNRRGYFIQNGGYYLALSDYFDLAILGDYYTNSSYGLRFESKYNVRYKFNGNFGFRYENLVNSERGFPDYSKSTIYNLRWSHSQDQKANPSSRFSASVNLGSSTYYQQSINQINLPNTQNNTLASSISYSKTFDVEPQINYSITATHSQNTQTQQIDMTLPTFQGSIGRIYPLAPKEGVKKGLIENINFQYNLRAENRISTTDSLFFKPQMFDDARIGARHSIPLTTNFKIFNFFSVSSTASFDETWTLNTVEKVFDAETNETITTDLTGFDAFRTYNFSTSLGTTLYGLFNFDKNNEGKKIQAIRHVVRPSISYNINPAFDNYYDSVEVINADGDTAADITRQEYTRFEGGVFGVPNKTFSSSIGLSLSNNFEAKVRDRDTTATEAKKIVLLNNLNFSTGYNVAGDSLKWSPVRMTGGTQLFKDKMAVNFGATLDPYALDNNNNRIDTYNINNNGSLFRLTTANMTVSYSLNSKGNESKNNRDSATQGRISSGGREDDLFGVSQDFSDNQFADDDEEGDEDVLSELYNFKIPWSLRLSYAVNYNNSQRQNEISSHSLMFSGDIEIAPRWSIGGNSAYDFKNKGFGFTQLRFSRDLLSWKMNFSWVPFGEYNSWNFFIGIKSNLLKDLKYEQRRKPDERL
jgi:lipopolysaccharide assembly outer membrane protein LptD (OstA)